MIKIVEPITAVIILVRRQGTEADEVAAVTDGRAPTTDA